MARTQRRDESRYVLGNVVGLLAIGLACGIVVTVAVLHVVTITVAPGLTPPEAPFWPVRDISGVAAAAAAYALGTRGRRGLLLLAACIGAASLLIQATYATDASLGTLTSLGWGAIVVAGGLAAFLMLPADGLVEEDTNRLNPVALTSLLLVLLAQPSAIVLGVIAFRQIERTEERGTSLAIAAVVIAALLSVGGLLFLIVLAQSLAGFAG